MAKHLNNHSPESSAHAASKLLPKNAYLKDSTSNQKQEYKRRHKKRARRYLNQWRKDLDV